MFKMMDTDNSGTISRSEVKTFFSMSNTVDENGDGEISFSEFKGMMDKFLNKI